MSHSFCEGRSVVQKNSKRTSRHRGLILGAAVASALAGMTSSAQATDYSWVGTTGGPSFWNVGTNWNPNTGFPSSTGDNALFGNGVNDFIVDLNGTSQSINNLTFGNTAGSYVLNNGGVTIIG